MRPARQSPVPRAKNIGHTSLLTRASTIGNSSAQPQLRRSPHADTTAVPPRRRTRCISPIAAGGDGTYIRPSEHSATSNGPVASSCSASQRRTSTLASPASPRPSLGVVDHLLGQVGRQHGALGADRGRRGQGDHPGPAGDVDHVLTGLQIGRRQEPLVGRPQLLLPVRLVVAHGSIPSLPLHPAVDLDVHVRQPAR